MTKRFWWLWLVPFGAWGVSMCWISGYEAGFEAGHGQAWESLKHVRTWDDALREANGDEEALRRVSMAH